MGVQTLCGVLTTLAAAVSGCNRVCSGVGGAGGGGGGSLCHRQQRVGDFHRGEWTCEYDEWAPQPRPRFLDLFFVEGLRADHDPHCAQEEGGDRGGILPLLAGAQGGPRPVL
jgi:hypothetical protein